MWPVNSYNSKYGKNDDKPIGYIAEDGLEVSVGFADEQILLLDINSVYLFHIDKGRSNEKC